MKPTQLFNTFLFLLLFSAATISAQNNYYNSYAWEKTPVLYVPNDVEKKSDLVIVLDKRFMEVAYDSDGQAVIYETIHRIFHANNDKAVDQLNKGYIPVGKVLEEMDLKARCIGAGNKVTFFNKSSLKRVDNFEDSGPYNIFAIDGVEPGCDVEILYTNKKKFSYYAFNYIDPRSPMVTYESRIISPKNLIFEVKCYNGLENFKSDTSNSEKNHLYLTLKNKIPAEKEKYSGGLTNCPGFIYQLARNTDKSAAKLYSWDIISADYYKSLFTLEKDETRAVEKLINKNKLSAGANEEEKIATLDRFLKTQFEISENFDELTFSKALDNKKMSYGNGLRFYISALKQMQIPFELVFTTDRTDVRFDPKFPSYLFMKEYVLYFPSIGKYVSPLSIYSRLNFPSPDVLSNDGLFLKEVTLGSLTSTSAKTKSLPVADYKNSYHNFDVKVTLDPENSKTNIQVVQSLGGYLAYYIQPIYRYLTEEQSADVMKSYYLTENQNGVKDLKVQNYAEEDLYKKPLLISFTVEQNDFLENANGRYIFKAGQLIGQQAELYQEEKRRSPGEMNYPHLLSRTLEIQIPKGYKAANLDQLIIEKKCVLGDQELASFKSSYEVKDSKVIVTVYEDYRATTYPLEVFNSFKEVINAAADFNKKTIIFEKL